MMQQLGQVIAQQRQAFSMSQEALAAKAGIKGGRSAMSRIESGQRELSIEQLRDVAAVFGLRGWELLRLAEDAPVEVVTSGRVPYTVVVQGNRERVVE
jgi:transcriptional regulator with XRE-family HTH domain